jgi:hypothetical protein
MVKALTEQVSYANKIINQFGKDLSGTIEYSFNSSGFRSPTEFNTKPELIVAGGSIFFGVGADFKNIASSVIAEKKNIIVWNLSYAQYYYDNTIIYDTVMEVYKQTKDIPIAIQWVSDQRNLSATRSVYSYIDEIKKIFNKSFHCLIDGQEQKENMLIDQFDLINPVWFDRDISGTHPGKLTHSTIARFIIERLYEQDQS